MLKKIIAITCLATCTFAVEKGKNQQSSKNKSAFIFHSKTLKKYQKINFQ